MIAREQHRPHVQVVTREAKFVDYTADKVESNAINLSYRTGHHCILQGPLADGNLVTREIIFENHLGGLGQPAFRLE